MRLTLRRVPARLLLLAMAALCAVGVGAFCVEPAHATCGDHVLVLGSRSMTARAMPPGMVGEFSGALPSTSAVANATKGQRPAPCDGPHCKQQAPQTPAPVPPTVRTPAHDQLAYLLRSADAAGLPLLRMIESFDLRPSDGYRSLIERPPRV